MRICIYGAKGGQGVTTLASVVAVTAMRYAVGLQRVGIEGRSHDDIAAVFGISGKVSEETPLKTDGDRQIILSPAVAELVIHDCGEIDAYSQGTDFGVLVTRNDYYAARRAVKYAKSLDGMVLIIEERRALGVREMTDCVGLPIISLLDLDHNVARANDAGVITSRLPDSMALVGCAILKAAGVELADPSLVPAAIEEVIA